MRQVLYLCASLLLMAFQWRIASVFRAEMFEEENFAENVQVVFLGGACFFFLLNAFLRRGRRSICFFCASLCALAFCREFDNTLDEMLPCISWRIGFLFPAIAGIYAVWNRKGFVNALCSFFKTPSCIMLFQATLIVLMAQMIGHNAFIKAILVEIEHIHSVKELFEEAAELIGYFVILCASIELLFEAKPQNPKP